MTSSLSSGANRIAGKGRLSPVKTVNFSFDGRQFTALEGDTLASALLANGIHLTGRSYKYHRPRGILSSGADEPNALMDISRDQARRQPNQRATVQEVFDGLNAKSQNAWPSLSLDIGAVNNLVAPFLSAGFYYKTFMWPKAAWHKIYEPIIRRAAGLGTAPPEPDPDRYANRFAYCDLLIIGGGAAGLMVAKAAAKSKKRIILVDENAEFGGWLRAEIGAKIDGKDAMDWVAETVSELAALENVILLQRTTGFGYYSHNMLALAERVTDHLAAPGPDLPRERLWQVRAKKVVLATGAIERHLVFNDNDRPAIMTASAARLYLNHYGVAVGRKVAVYTACDSAWEAAFDLKKAGIKVVAIIDTRAEPGGGLKEQAEAMDIPVRLQSEVIGTKGRTRVKSITVETANKSEKEKFEVDCLLVSGGWTPSVHLFSQSRGRLKFDQSRQIYLPDQHGEEAVSIGACNGSFDIDDTLKEAAEAAAWAVDTKASKPPKTTNFSSMAGQLIGVPDKTINNGMAFVDFQHDVCAKDIGLAVHEGMHSIEHVKRYTTTGMATDQGKMSNMHGLGIAAEALEKPIPEVGLTTFRAPYSPVSFGTLINHTRGELFDVARTTPMHCWATEQGAVFEDVGNWKRAWYFPQAGETMGEAVARETKTTREVAGIFDASTLGKIEVVGADAVKFMNLIYTNPWDKLPVGMCRYSIMCREDGYIYDDGVVGRLAQDRFHVTTTTGGAPRVLNMMEDYLQTEFPDWKVFLTSTSEQWAVIAVQGPKSREIIAPLVEDIDLSPDAMPHMAIREGKICGVQTRLMRVSFTGELGFEINVPADYGKAVWEAIWQRGVPLGMTAYGTEAMHVMRAEKGFIIVGQDTDGTVTPIDAGLGWAIGKKKTDFVGIKGLQRPDLVADGRRQLIGLKTSDPKIVLEEGAQIVADPNQPVPMQMIGFVTSAYWSETLGHSIAMALVEDGFNRMGKTLYVPMPGETHKVEVCETVFLDKQGARLNV